MIGGNWIYFGGNLFFIYALRVFKKNCMHPSSRESNRSAIGKAISYLDPQPSAFNESFYQEKLTSSQNYSSFQYIKRYLNETNLSFTIEKMMNIVLKLEKLPENPYNLMYRLIHHEAIYENLRRFYNQNREYENMINYNIEPDGGDSDEQIQKNQHMDNFRRIKMKDKQAYLSQKLIGYINSTNIFVFSKIVQSKRAVDKYKALAEKYNMQDVYLSYGGPIILNLRGNKGYIDIPSKLPKQLAERSLYCNESMLTCTLFINSNRQITKSFQEFSQFILQDLIEMIQYKDENYTIYFQKLQLFNIDEIFNIIEFSREQIISNGIILQKEIVKNIEKENMIIRAKCIYRLSKDLANVVGEQFITVYKEYILIAKVDNTLSVLSNEPLKYALRQAFLNSAPLEMILDHEQYKGKKLNTEFKIEMIHTLINNLKNQHLTQLVWDLFYCILYEQNNEENAQLILDLNQTISYILLSPISFVYKLIYTLRCVKWLALPSFPTLSQNEAYQLIIDSEREITAFIQRGNYIYWELQIFYEAIKRLLSIIVEFKQLKINAIIFIIDHALLMLNGVTINFSQILLVLQGNVLNYINVLRNASAERIEQILNDNIISYENYIKNKELPMRVLKLHEQIKKAKKQLNLSENEVKMVIMSKYVSKYKLYQKIYRFYWQLFMGKKVTYPLSKFLKLLMINSTQCSYELFKQSYIKPKFKIEVNQINELSIYEINNPETSFIFYSLSPASLNIYTLKEYKAILEIIKPFFEEEVDDDTLGFRYGSKTTIQTSPMDSDRRKQNKVTMGIKSIEIGDNIGQEITSFNQCRLLIDILLYRAFNNKYDLYTYMLDYLYELMDRLDKENYSILGIYSYYQNHYNILNNEEFIYTKILNEENHIRYDYKKKCNIQKFVKFIDTSISQGKFIEAKVLYTVRDVVKVMKLSFNFYYKGNNQNQYFSIFKPNFILERVYSSKKELLTWCEISNFQSIKQYISNNAKITSKENIMDSLKKLQEEKEVSIIDILSEKELDQEKEVKIKQLSKVKYYKQSPFYNLFQRALEMLENIQILIDYLKSDRRGRYELSHLRKIYSLLKYYLIDKCLIKDDFIYSQGTSVSIINLMTYLQEYLDRHPDNNGEERELLYLERIITKLANLVKFEEISCSVCIYESLNLPLETEFERYSPGQT